MNKDEIKATAEAVYKLAEVCRVPMLKACKRINMATSTPHRWLNNGSEPAPEAVRALRGSILRLAAEKGTLPKAAEPEYRIALKQPKPTHRTPDEIAQDIAKGVDELQKSLAARC